MCHLLALEKTFRNPDTLFRVCDHALAAVAYASWILTYYLNQKLPEKSFSEYMIAPLTPALPPLGAGAYCDVFEITRQGNFSAVDAGKYSITATRGAGNGREEASKERHYHCQMIFCAL